MGFKILGVFIENKIREGDKVEGEKFWFFIKGCISEVKGVIG